MPTKLPSRIFSILLIVGLAVLFSMGNTLNAKKDPPADKTAFITKWKTDNTKFTVTNSKQVKLPLSADGAYNFVADWGDGTSNRITRYNQKEVIHTYLRPGTYTITIKGKIEGFGFFFSEEGDKSKFIDVAQWGEVKLHNKGYQFAFCDNLSGFSADDRPKLKHVSNFQCMFVEASSFNGDISQWDMSSVTNMKDMFYKAEAFNGDISEWDVSGVTNMRGMFAIAGAFNGDISKWDVSSVTNMRGMFAIAKAFNGDISQWDVANVTDMKAIFARASSFNSDISKWNVSKVINMSSMFYEAKAFNRDLSGWCVTLIGSEPEDFAVRSPLDSSGKKPGWGRCPGKQK